VPVARQLCISLPPLEGSPARARRALRIALREAGLEPNPVCADTDTADRDLDADLVDTAVLLASELCDNAVLHGGTGFEFAVAIDAVELTVTVTDHGVGPLEQRLAAAHSMSGRAAAHGRGLVLLDRLSDAWGTRHDAAGHHTWFSLARHHRPVDSGTGPPSATATGSAVGAVPAPGPASTAGRSPPAEPSVPGPASRWPSVAAARRLLGLPVRLSGELTLAEDVRELLRRLGEVIEPRAATVILDYGDGQGPAVLARTGPDPTRGRDTVSASLPLNAPLCGVLTVVPASGTGAGLGDLVALCAHRIALSVESAWLRGLDRRQQAWMAYLAQAGELLGLPREVGLTAAMVPQIVVPRLGLWCGVHLSTARGTLELAALAHADETRLGELRAALEDPHDPARAQLAQIVRAPGDPVEVLLGGALGGLAVALVSRGQVRGLLTVAHPAARGHTPEEISVISDLARRVGVAIGNVQHLAEQQATSQTLQRALLPAALPAAPGIEFAADYLPASAASAVGGDFYDVLELAPDRRWLACIGDVCGKGAHAAARTGLVRDVLRVLLRDGRPPEQALAAVNDVLLEARDPFQFCTLATALISRTAPDQPPGLTVSLVLAGHEPPVLLRADGRTELVGAAGTPLGLLPTITVIRSTHHLSPGDALIAYTDGVTEQRHRLRHRPAEQFGHQRLRDTLAAVAARPAPDIVAHLREAIVEFAAEDPQYDDIALLVIRARPDPPRPAPKADTPTPGDPPTSTGPGRDRIPGEPRAHRRRT
jgi:serine phosphatase RsbU (regulator of sigma subunit)/anti-sigma regulatory factor (Ser/Thr protein kinase)